MYFGMLDNWNGAAGICQFQTSICYDASIIRRTYTTSIAADAVGKYLVRESYRNIYVGHILHLRMSISVHICMFQHIAVHR